MTDENKKPDKTGLPRKGFLAVAGSATGALIMLQASKPTKASSNLSGSEPGAHKWGMVIDINLCIGCNYCTYACQAVNDLPVEMKYNKVTLEETKTGAEFYLSRPCMQCEHPPCVHVCPVGATYVRDDGIVTMDYDLCIGCRYCTVACPYDARVFNWKEHIEPNAFTPEYGHPEVERRPRGVMEKCNFCEHRIDSGLARGLVPGIDAAATPACVDVCPTGARVFGDLNDSESPISKILASTKTPIRLREDLSTEPKVYYIPPQAEVTTSSEEEL